MCAPVRASSISRSTPTSIPHFVRTARRSYRLRWHGYKYRLHPWRPGSFHGFRGFDRIERLRSFRGLFYPCGPRRVSFGDCVGVLGLIHPDEDVMLDDVRFIRQLESEDLFNIGPPGQDDDGEIGR